MLHHCASIMGVPRNSVLRDLIDSSILIIEKEVNDFQKLFNSFLSCLASISAGIDESSRAVFWNEVDDITWHQGLQRDNRY